MAGEVDLIRIIAGCLDFLPKSDRRRILLMMLAQALLSLLDLVAVSLFAVLGSVVVRGVKSESTGSRVDSILNLIGVGQLEFQTKVAVIAVFASLLLVSKTVISVMITRRSLYYLSRKSAELSSALVERVVVRERHKLAGLSTQDFLYTSTQGVNNLVLGVIGTSVALVSDIALVGVISISLVLVDVLTAFLTGVLFGGIGLALYLGLHRKSDSLGREQANLTVASNIDIVELQKAYREILTRNSFQYFVGRISSKRKKLSSALAEQAFLPYVGKYVVETAIVLGTLVLSGVQFISKNSVEAAATLSFFVVAASRLAPAILRIQQSGIAIRFASSSSQSTANFLREKDESTLIEIPDSPRSFRPMILVSKMSFKYPNSDHLVLRDIDLEVQEGQFVAFVGPSGSGKSTLIDLLLGVLKPTSGEILISDRVPELASQLWPGQIAYVPQDVYISQDSLRSNLLLGLSELTYNDEILWDRLNEVGLKADFEKVGITLESSLGEDGSLLSGGQKQRIGIARALLTDPSLLVMDEATSALDGVTESGIAEVISSGKSKRTLLVIAHRLSTIKRADLVVYLEQGEIIARGNILEVREKVPDFDRQAELMGL